jgi:hypothetical protein
LQFRDLTYASVPHPNNSTSAFLTVDDAGNVVLMQPPPTLLTPKGNIVIQKSLILKASDGDNYFIITVNSKGELKTTPIDKQSL